MLKLVAGSKAAASRGAAGFTLIEMLVVLTIVALALAIVVPAVSKSMVATVYDVARDVQISLRQARANAVSQQQATVFWVDAEQHQYLTHKNKTKSFPEDISMRIKVATREVQGRKASVRFFPDGSSTGGRLMVSDANVTVQVEIDWLTGRISVTDEN